MTVYNVLEAHIPSLTERDEQIILQTWSEWDSDVADLAVRTCHCGVKIDGFYEYVDHLRDEFRKAGL